MGELTVPKELEQEPPAILTQARALAVTSPDSFASAAEFLKKIKGAAKSVVDFFKPLKQSADEHKRSLLDAERKLTGPLAEAEVVTKKAMLAYEAEGRRKAEEERRKLQAEADERARREREALEKQAAKAKKPETQAKYAEAAAEVVAPVVAVEAPVPTVKGISTREVWKARVIDAAKVPREFLDVNLSRLDGYARAMKQAAKADGVEFYSETVMSAGR